MDDRRRRRHDRNPPATKSTTAPRAGPLSHALNLLDALDEATQLGSVIKTSASAAVQTFHGTRKAARLVKRLRRRKQALPQIRVRRN